MDNRASACCAGRGNDFPDSGGTDSAEQKESDIKLLSHKDENVIA